MTDPYKCGRCGLPVSPGVCAPQPHVFHDRPEHCLADLVPHVTKLRAALTVILHGRCDPQDAARRARAEPPTSRAPRAEGLTNGFAAAASRPGQWRET